MTRHEEIWVRALIAILRRSMLSVETAVTMADKAVFAFQDRFPCNDEPRFK